jgi:hypothetical protein
MLMCMHKGQHGALTIIRSCILRRESAAMPCCIPQPHLIGRQQLLGQHDVAVQQRQLRGLYGGQATAGPAEVIFEQKSIAGSDTPVSGQVGGCCYKCLTASHTYEHGDSGNAMCLQLPSTWGAFYSDLRLQIPAREAPPLLAFTVAHTSNVALCAVSVARLTLNILKHVRERESC